jgi:hypothetical protein
MWNGRRVRVVGIVWLAALAAAATLAGGARAGVRPGRGAHVAGRLASGARGHLACSGANAAHTRCRFSTPTGNVRCEWTPAHDTVVCELLATGRAYRLRATGHATLVRVHLTRRGQTLPTDQQLVFPHQLSCHDTRTTMTCNQDFLTGEFKLAPGGSHSS